jgi:hypothetical protein
MLQDVYIQRRKDGAKGSGTFDDPFNALVLNSNGTDNAGSSATLLDGFSQTIFPS